MPPPALRQKKVNAPQVRRSSRGPSPGFVWRIALGVAAIALVLSVSAALQDDRWNPFTPLNPNLATTPITPLKLTRTAADPQQCRAALDMMEGAAQAWLSDREHSEICHIRNRALVSEIAGARVQPVETRCAIALRLGMWARHSVQPAATAHLGSRVAEIQHFSSYSCRSMRTSRGNSTAMSAHATASAIDISAVRLEDGRTLSLRSSWNSSPETEAFWREIRDSACTYFRTVLSPDYNSLHADHFHFAQGRWPTCR